MISTVEVGWTVNATGRLVKEALKKAGLGFTLKADDLAKSGEALYEGLGIPGAGHFNGSNAFFVEALDFGVFRSDLTLPTRDDFDPGVDQRPEDRDDRAERTENLLSPDRRRGWNRVREQQKWHKMVHVASGFGPVPEPASRYTEGRHLESEDSALFDRDGC